MMSASLPLFCPVAALGTCTLAPVPSVGSGGALRGGGCEPVERVAAGTGSDLLNSFVNAPNICSKRR